MIASRFDKATAVAAVTGIVIVFGAWAAAYFLIASPDGVQQFDDRLAFAIGWIAVAALFVVTMAVEAVAHERLQTDAFDPLAGHETRRLKVNQRFLQNSLEQFVLFAAGLLAIAADGVDGRASRLITATALSWLLARYLFWLGYHRSSAMRVIGIAGQAQTMLVLIFLVCRFGERHLGIAGVVGPLLFFGAMEFALVLNTRHLPKA